MTSGSLLVVSGGGRGITAECVVALAERYRCRFLLLGRTPLEQEPAWAAGCEDEADLKRRIAADLQTNGAQPAPAAIQRAFEKIVRAREINRTLGRVAEAGGAAEYLSADVCDAEALPQALEPAIRRLGPAAGLIHGAGAIADKPVEYKSLAEFEAVYDTKVKGLQNLLACLPIESLDWLILFSSAVGFFGNAGQSDYAMANEILNRMALRAQALHPRCRVLSLNWGPWDGGMVTPDVKRRFEQAGIQVIEPAAGAQALLRAIKDGGAPTQALVGAPWRMPAEPASRTSWTIRRRLSTAQAPCVLDHVIGGHPVLPAVCAAGWLVDAGERLYPGFRFTSASDLRVLKGVVFDEELAPEFLLHVDEQQRSPDEVRYRATVTSSLPDGRERYHYVGEAVLGKTPPPRPRLHDIDLSENEKAVDGPELYRSGLLFHGPTFQGIERVLRLEADLITMRCRLPAVDAATQGQFPVSTFNPYLADVQLQSVLVWALKMRGVPGHPLHLEGLQVFATPPFDEVLYVTTRIRRADSTAVVGDSVLHDDAGWVYVNHSGVELTLNAAPLDGIRLGAVA